MLYSETAEIRGAFKQGGDRSQNFFGKEDTKKILVALESSNDFQHLLKKFFDQSKNEVRRMEMKKFLPKILRRFGTQSYQLRSPFLRTPGFLGTMLTACNITQVI